MTNELAGWDQVRASVAQAATAASRGGANVVLASNHYSMCGRLSFEMGDSPPVYCPTARRTAFDFFGRRNVPANATVIAVTNDIHADLPAGLEGRTCELADEVTIERAGRQVAHYLVRSCAPARRATKIATRANGRLARIARPERGGRRLERVRASGAARGPTRVSGCSGSPLSRCARGGDGWRRGRSGST